MASVHKRIFKIGATVLALKLEKRRVLGGDNPPYFSNHEDDTQSQQDLVCGKVVSRYITKKIHDNAVQDNVTVTSSNFS